MLPSAKYVLSPLISTFICLGCSHITPTTDCTEQLALIDALSVECVAGYETSITATCGMVSGITGGPVIGGSSSTYCIVVALALNQALAGYTESAVRQVSENSQ